MSGTTGVRKQKLYLLEKYKYCYWCGILVKDYNYKSLSSKPPHDEATIDHMFSRRFRKKGERTKKVLACYKCNSERDKREFRKIVLINMIFKK